jgi:glyoxylase-like metal-dependent hydrolase (beta-lactamase superfamily II)
MAGIEPGWLEHPGSTSITAASGRAVTMIRVVPIRLRWSNAYLLIGEAAAILVDTGTAGEIERLVAAIESQGVSPGDIVWILHTHGHPDHCGNTAEFQARYRTQTAIHRLDEEIARRPESIRLRPTGIAGYILAKIATLPLSPFVPDVLLERDDELDRFGLPGMVLHTPGHTPGSLSVLINQHDAIAGDLLMGGLFAGKLFLTRPRQHYFADDPAQVRSSVQRLLGMGAKRLYVGHGGPLDPARIETKQLLVSTL